MRTITTEVFTYSELSDAAKAKARDWYRETSQGDNYFSESVIEDAATIAALLGIELKTTRKAPCIHWSGFACQGDGASFEGDFDPKAMKTPDLFAHAPTDEKLHAVAVNILEAAQAIPGEWTANISLSGHRYVHSNMMQIDIEQGEDETEISPEMEKALLDSLRAFADWIYSQLESEYEYQNSDDAVADIIEANEYEFEANGARART
jgi:hypothetical protein